MRALKKEGLPSSDRKDTQYSLGSRSRNLVVYLQLSSREG